MDKAWIYAFGITLLVMPFAFAGIVGGSGTAADPYLWNVTCGDVLNGMGIVEATTYITVINDADCSGNNQNYAFLIQNSKSLRVDFNGHHITNVHSTYGGVILDSQHITINSLYLSGDPTLAMAIIGSNVRDIWIQHSNISTTNTDGGWALYLLGSDSSNGIFREIHTVDDYFKGTAGGILVYLGCSLPADGSCNPYILYEDSESTFDVKDSGVLYVNPPDDVCSNADSFMLDDCGVNPKDFPVEVEFLKTKAIGPYGTVTFSTQLFNNNLAQSSSCVDSSYVAPDGTRTDDDVPAVIPTALMVVHDDITSLPVPPLGYSLVPSDSLIVSRTEKSKAEACLYDTKTYTVIYHSKQDCNSSSVWWWNETIWQHKADCGGQIQWPAVQATPSDYQTPINLTEAVASYFISTFDEYVENYTHESGYVWKYGKYVSFFKKNLSAREYIENFDRAVEVLFDSQTPAVSYHVEYFLQVPLFPPSTTEYIIQGVKNVSVLKEYGPGAYVKVAQSNLTDLNGLAPIYITNTSLYTQDIFKNLLMWVVYDNDGHVVAKGHARIPKLHVITLAPTVNFAGIIYKGLVTRSNLLVLTFIIFAISIGLFGLGKGGLTGAIITTVLLILMYSFQPMNIAFVSPIIGFILGGLFAFFVFRGD